MQKVLLILISHILVIITLGQNIDCDSLYRHQLTIHSDNNKDAFCRGVELANNSKVLEIRMSGDPGNVTYCEHYSYSYYGVKLVLTGDIASEEQSIENAGFNAIMIPRIKDSLGINYKNLGKQDSSWHNLDDATFINELKSTIVLKDITDSTVTAFIHPEFEKNSIFKSLSGARFSYRGQDWYTRDSLLLGITFKILIKGFLHLSIDFTSYQNSNNICQAVGIWSIPIKIE